MSIRPNLIITPFYSKPLVSRSHARSHIFQRLRLPNFVMIEEVEASNPSQFHHLFKLSRHIVGMNFSAPKPTGPERRRRPRVATDIAGRIVFSGVGAECHIRQMSATGALVEALPLPALKVPLALDIPGIGFARGEAVRYVGVYVCIRLAPSLRLEQIMSDRLQETHRLTYPGD